ncbi:MAG: response regulator [Bacteroidales bacterium]|nr:response regulator [Bacteroidales bacterium]
MKLKTVVVEDEILGQDVILSILKNYCDQDIEIVGVTTTVEDSVNVIRNTRPHLVFLDIRLGTNDQGAFDILKTLGSINFKIVFTTSSIESSNILVAVNKYGAKKYLLKPLEIDEVIDVVASIKNEVFSQSVNDELIQLKEMIQTIRPVDSPNLIQLPVRNGFQCINSEDLIMLRSNSNSTILFLASGETVTSTKNLHHFETTLPAHRFIRVSKSHIINLDHVTRYTIEDGGTIFLSQNCSAAISAKYRTYFMSFFNK